MKSINANDFNELLNTGEFYDWMTYPEALYLVTSLLKERIENSKITVTFDSKKAKE